MNSLIQKSFAQKLLVSSVATLLVGCSSGGSSGVSAGTGTATGVDSSAWIAPILSGTPQVGATTEIPTSSSGLKVADLMDVINGGGTLTTKSLVLSSYENNSGRTQLSSNVDVEMTFQSDGEYSMVVDGDNFPNASIHGYDLSYVGEYGMLANAKKTEASSTEFANVTILAGTRTDNADIPTTGNATYSANEDSYYEDYADPQAGETPPLKYNNLVTAIYTSPNGESYDNLEDTYDEVNGLETNGNFTMTLEADFAQSTVKGSAEGVVSDGCCDSSANTHLPLVVTFDESSIAQSSFNGTGTASVDNQEIPINYGGNFFGPEAAEVGLFFEGQNDNNNVSVGGSGYLTKQ